VGCLPSSAATSAARSPGWEGAVGRYLADPTGFRQAFAGELERFRPEVFAAPDLDRWQTEAADAAGKVFGVVRPNQPNINQTRPLQPNSVQVRKAGLAAQHVGHHPASSALVVGADRFGDRPAVAPRGGRPESQWSRPSTPCQPDRHGG
jgi:hypothetical protein